MKKTKLTDQQHLVVVNNEQLLRYLESLNEAQPYTKRSWLYENQSAEEVLESWMNTLRSLEHGSAFEKEVFQFDTSQLQKWGPQGGHPPISEAMDVVEQGFGAFSSPKIFTSPDWLRACEEFNSRFARGASLRPASYKAVVDDMRARDVLESNSGWPDFSRRNLPEVKEAALRDAESGEWSTYPAIALFRYYNKKLRLVWMFPMSANLVEGSFTQPLQRHIQQRDEDGYFAPWAGFAKVQEQITAAYASGKYLAASDFSSTDAHFRWPTTNAVFQCIKNCFQRNSQALLRGSLYNMHNIPLVIGPDSQLLGNHGVSSGSNWTNLIETIFDYLFSTYVSFQTPYRGLSAIGDDMCWVSDTYDEGFAKDLERLGKLVGQQIKSDKTTNVRDSVKYLQRLFQRGYNLPDGRCRGVYSTIRALKSCIYPERFHKPKLWNSDMFCIRQYMILENCVDHPLFEEFVKFVVHGQKDLIPFAHKTDSDLERIRRESRLLPGLNPTYNQEKRDHSLGDFASIGIARSL